MHCARHEFEAAYDVCEHCALGFCALCLVYPRGDRKPPLCQRCALALSGVRKGLQVPAAPRKVFRQRRREVLDRRLGRPATMAEVMTDLSWLDDVEYGSAARVATSETVIDWKV
jgi:hypothetical protein